MQIVESVLKAQIHGAFGALKILNIRQLGPAPLGLTVTRPIALPFNLLVPPQILLELALAGLNVLVPEDRGGYALLREAL